MATGKILRFDEIRGYGFIAPDSGGEDVFLHANALLAEKHQYHPGVPVEFDVIEGERGLKATAVRVVKGRATTPASPASAATPATAARPIPSPAVQAPATHGLAAQPQAPSTQAPAAQPHATPTPTPQTHTAAANGSSATGATAVTGATGVATAAPPMATPATVAAATTHGSPAIAPQRSANGSERPARDLVSPDALGSELVELCLESVPSMTGEQISQLRRAVVTLAQRHGWVTETA